MTPLNPLQGQNEIMHDWLQHCAQRYLATILEGATADSMERTCDTCSTGGDMYHCSDCLHNQILCGPCLNTLHRSLPTHRFNYWTGTFFKRVPSAHSGYRFDLGHGGAPCNNGQDRMFTLGDLTGIHNINVRFCRHPGRGDQACQLIRARVFPCSDIRPSSGFTFNVLKNFYLLYAEAKVSGQRYYNVLEQHTRSAFPHLVPSRYREFHRVSRQWDHLHDLRRAGSFDLRVPVSPRGDLALRCPACPRININYWTADINPELR